MARKPNGGTPGRPGGIAGSLTISKPLLDAIMARDDPAEMAALTTIREIVARAKANKRFGAKSPADLAKMLESERARVSLLEAAIADAKARGVPEA